MGFLKTGPREREAIERECLAPTVVIGDGGGEERGGGLV